MKISEAAWFGFPSFVTPQFSLSAIAVIAPVFIVLVAENKGHIAAVSNYMNRDLNPMLGRAYLGNALATFVAALGGGTPQTTYAENIGVMAITKVFAASNFVAASLVAICLGLCPKFGAVIQSIPEPVLGGITLVLYSLITIMGIKIWIDAKVDFSENRNLFVAGVSLIVATGIGPKGIMVGNLNLAGIGIGTMLAVILHAIFSLKKKN
jgi:xanthine/uracil permease